MLGGTTKIKIFNEKTSVLYQTKYCAQEDFGIALRMNRNIKRLEHPFSLNSYEESKNIGVVTKRRYNSKTVSCSSSLFMISENRSNNTFEKYSELSENKSILPTFLDRRFNFCVCSFMQKIYVIGGCGKTQDRFGSSFIYVLWPQ